MHRDLVNTTCECKDTFQLALISVWLNCIATPSSFRLNDPLSFVQGAMVFETVAGSAYIIAGSRLKQEYDLIFAEVRTPPH